MRWRIQQIRSRHQQPRPISLKSPTSPFWSSFPLGCSLQGLARANRLSPSSASTSGTHLAWQFQPQQPSTITFTFLPAQSDIQQVIFTTSASPNPLSCCLREQAAGRSVAIVTCYSAIKCKLWSLLKPHIILDSSCCCYQQDPYNTSLLDVNPF